MHCNVKFQETDPGTSSTQIVRSFLNLRVDLAKNFDAGVGVTPRMGNDAGQCGVRRRRGVIPTYHSPRAMVPPVRASSQLRQGLVRFSNQMLALGMG